MLIVILSVSVGINGRYSEGEIVLIARVGPFKTGLLPKNSKKRHKKEKKTGSGKKAKKPADKKLISAVLKLVPKTMKRLKQRLNIDLLRIHWTAAARDPFDAAVQYGRVFEAEALIAPLVGRYLNVKKWDLKTDISFERSEPVISVELATTLRIWAILYIAVVFGADFIRIKNRLRKESAQKEKENRNG